MRFTTESGLPSNHVTALTETQNGIAWVCTASGAAWFDGYRWNMVDSSKGLPQTYSENISSGSDNNVVVYLPSGLLFQGSVTGFRQIVLPWRGTHEVSTSSDKIIVHYHADLFLYEHDSLTNFNPRTTNIGGPSGGRGLWVTKAGNIWMNTEKGLFRLEGKSWVNKIRSIYRDRSFYVNYLVEDSKGRGVVSIGLPFESRGLWEWDSRSIPKINRSIRGDWIKTMDINNEGNIVAVEKSGEISLRRGGKWSRLQSIPVPMRNVEFLKFRTNGDLWVGTKKGLFLFKQYRTQWEHKSNRLPNRNRIHEIVRSVDGSLWLGTADGVEIHKPDGEVKFITHINNRPLNEVTGVAEDQKGNIWISSGSGFDGTYRWNGIAWTYFRVDPALEWLKFHKIRKDREGRLWFLGLSKDFESNVANQPGAFAYENGLFTRWCAKDGLTGGRIYSFAEGEGKSLWFGTERGISRWRNGNWRHWRKSIDIPSDAVFTLATDHEGKVWFSDRISGLYSIDRNDKIEKYSTEEGLLDNRVWDLAVDIRGKLWISTEGGLCCLDQGRWKKFDAKSGLLMTDLWPVLPLGDSVFVGTRGKGLSILNLRRCYQPPPKIYFSNSVVEGNKVFIRVLPFEFWGEIEPHEILTRYSLNNNAWSGWSTVHDVTINDLEPGNYSFAVQGQNLYGEYDATGTRDVFTISPPLFKRPVFIFFIGGIALILIVTGVEYALRRKKTNRELRESESKFRRLTESSFEGIVILRGDLIQETNQRMCKIFGYDYSNIVGKQLNLFFFPESHSIIEENLRLAEGKPFEALGIRKDGKTIWIEIIATSIPHEPSAISVAAIRDITERKYDEEKLLNYQAQLRSLVSELVITEERERRRMAEFLHDIIGQALAFCKIKLGTLKPTSNQEKFNQHLQEVRKLIDETIQNTRSLTYDLSPPILYELGFEPAVESLAEQISNQHGIEIHVTKTEQLIILNNNLRILLYQSVRELLINIVKHADATNVRIIISSDAENINIHLSDDGRGFNPSDMVVDNGSFGLFNIRERLRHLSGQFEIQSQPGHGTSVKISIPLSNNDELKSENKYEH